MSDRVIKFRIWNIKSKTWFSKESVFGQSFNFSNPENFKFQQFTGLLDKNGKEIFEGDIIGYNDCSEYEVIWKQDGWFVKRKGNSSVFYRLGDLFQKICIVTGNIFEGVKKKEFPVDESLIGRQIYITQGYGKGETRKIVKVHSNDYVVEDPQYGLILIHKSYCNLIEKTPVVPNITIEDVRAEIKKVLAGETNKSFPITTDSSFIPFNGIKSTDIIYTNI